MRSLDVVQLNNRFTIRFPGEQKIRALISGMTAEVILVASERSMYFAHPDPHHGKANCVRGRIGTVTVSNETYSGFVGHDVATNTLFVFGDNEDVIWHSDVVQTIEYL